MAATPIDYADLLRKDLPPAAVKWAGFPRYNFVGGHNDSASVPVDELIAAMTAVMTREGRTLATYNLESGAQGYLPLRQFMVKKLARDAGMTCSSDDILITSGSLQGLDLVNQILLEPGDTIIGEEATYGGSLTRVTKLGVSWTGVPLDKGGIRMDALDTILAGLKVKGVRPKYIYTIPTVQNPTATVMPVERRLELLALSEAYGVPIFEDECYADLTWTGERPKSLRALAGNTDRVIHIGSFSKNIAPALRIGYLVASWPLMGRIVSMKTDAGTGALEQMMLAEYCARHFNEHLPKLRTALKRKLDVLVESVHAEFGSAAEFDVPEGGIFLWIKLPDQVDTMKLFQIAAKEGVAINPGVEWVSNKELGRSRLRLCFANPTEQAIRDGVAKLAEICFREFGVPVRSGNVSRA